MSDDAYDLNLLLVVSDFSLFGHVGVAFGSHGDESILSGEEDGSKVEWERRE